MYICICSKVLFNDKNFIQLKIYRVYNDKTQCQAKF